MGRNSETNVTVRVIGLGVQGANGDTDGGQGAGTSDSKKITPTIVRRYNKIRSVYNSPVMSLAKQVVRAEIQYHISGIGIQTGDQFLQQNAERTWLKFNDGISVVGSTLTGAMAGAAAGGAVGALIGGTIALASAAHNISVRERGLLRDFQKTKFENDNNVGFVRSRSELSATTGRWRLG